MAIKEVVMQEQPLGHCIILGKTKGAMSHSSTKKHNLYCVKCGIETFNYNFAGWKIINPENGKGICISCEGNTEDLL